MWFNHAYFSHYISLPPSTDGWLRLASLQTLRWLDRTRDNSGREYTTVNSGRWGRDEKYKCRNFGLSQYALQISPQWAKIYSGNFNKITLSPHLNLEHLRPTPQNKRGQSWSTLCLCKLTAKKNDSRTQREVNIVCVTGRLCDREAKAEDQWMNEAYSGRSPWQETAARYSLSTRQQELPPLTYKPPALITPAG